MTSVPRPSWFSQAFEALTDLVFAFDHTGQIAYVNPSAESTLGIDRDAVVGQNFAALEPPARDRTGELTAILYVDLDRFKPVDDRHGHGTGDDVLVVIASRLSTVVRPSDLVARIGGDEFAVLCQGLTDVSEATAIADRIIKVVAEPVQLDGLEVVVDGSVGIALSTEAELDGDALLDAADRALYRAKREGRGRWALA